MRYIFGSHPVEAVVKKKSLLFLLKRQINVYSEHKGRFLLEMFASERNIYNQNLKMVFGILLNKGIS